MTQQECNIKLERERIVIAYAGSEYVSSIVRKTVEAWTAVYGDEKKPTIQIRDSA